MKKCVIINISLFISLFTYGQTGKKPIIMVVPSDVYCFSHGFQTNIETEEGVKTVVDYKQALQRDGDLQRVISKLGIIMAQRGFPLKDMLQTMKMLQDESSEMKVIAGRGMESVVYESDYDKIKRFAKADLILELDFEIKKHGPQKYIIFNLKGLDSYSGKQVAGVTGIGNPSTASPAELLLEEAVLNYIDSFNATLMNYFNDLFERGREISILIKRFDTGPELDDEFYYNDKEMELTDIIESWVKANAVNGRYSLIDNSENFIRFEQVRMPMYFIDNEGTEVSLDSRLFIKRLRDLLKSDPFGIPVKQINKGLGSQILILGDK